jgi:type I restriction enzyme S subunit
MSNWPLVTLGDVFEIARGGSPRPIDAYITEEPDGVNWIMIGDASEGSKYITGTTKRISKDGVQRSRMVQPGDFLLTNSMSFGKPYIMRTSGCIHDGWLVLTRRRDNIDTDFFYHLLRSKAVYSEFERRAAGATVKNLNIDLVRGVQVPLPPLPEQRRIAQVLDRADALRAKRRVALAQLDTLTQSIFLDLFGRPMVNERGWSMSTVGDAGLVQLGRQRAPKYQSGEHTRPYMRVANVHADRMDLTDVLSMDFDEADFATYQLEHGDILLNEGQSTELVGRPAMWRDELPTCCFQNTLLRFQPNRKITTPEFALATFLHYFRSGAFARISSKTSSVAHLGAGRFGLMPFPLPPLHYQREFSARMVAADKLKAAHRASLAELNALFSVLQFRAFRGEL